MWRIDALAQQRKRLILALTVALGDRADFRAERRIALIAQANKRVFATKAVS